MDIPRAPAQRGRKQLLYGGARARRDRAGHAGPSRAQARGAARGPRRPSGSTRSQRGPLVIEVRGPGTLVPERIRYISAVTAGRVERRLAEAGQEVKPETVLLELSNPDVQLEALESERQLTVSRADQVNLRANLAVAAAHSGSAGRRRPRRLSRRQAERRGGRIARGQAADLGQRGQPRPRPGRGAGHPLQGRAGAAAGDDAGRRLAALAAGRRRWTGSAT